MTSIYRLAPAHRGYEYQDLLVACRFVDVLLGSVLEARCDEKLFGDDRFDDLTTVDLDGIRERVQFKHTDDDDRPLTLDTFTKDQRRLRLDRLFDSMLTDRDGPGRAASAAVFRVALRDQSPTDPALTAVLKPGAREPGPFLAGTRTERLLFHAPALWEQRSTDAGEPSPFAFLFSGDTAPSYDELEWICDRLIVEVGASRASLDLTEPARRCRALAAGARPRRRRRGDLSQYRTDRSRRRIGARLGSSCRATGLANPQRTGATSPSASQERLRSGLTRASCRPDDRGAASDCGCATRRCGERAS